MEPYFVFFGNMTSSMVNGREHYIICSTVKLTKSVDVEFLRKAWVHLRFQQPKLAATADASDWTMHYTVPQEADIGKWLAETFFIVPDTSYDNLYPEFNPVKTASLYWLQQSNELIFRTPHWQTDGIGSWLFWDAFFTSFEKVQSLDTQTLSWGEEVARLSPAMQEIWKITEIDQSNREQGQALFGGWATNVPGVGPDPIKPTPGKCQKIELEFDQATTTSILNAIKGHGLTVTAAFHAVLASANAKAVSSANVKSNYATMSNINFRKYLGPPYTSSDQALNVYYVPVPLVTPVETFDKTANFMSKFYKQTYDEPGKQQMICAFFELLFQVAQSPEFLSAPVPGDAMLSSLGIAEQYFKPAYANGLIEISDVHNSIDIVLGMALAFLYTFDGKLRFTYCYNDGLQDRSVIEGIMGSIKAILKEEFSG